MIDKTISIVAAGLVTSVGFTAASSCAAIHCALSNVVETGFVDGRGNPLLGAQVPLEDAPRGRERLLQLIEPALRECLSALENIPAAQVPFLLCLAETSRPGRVEGLENMLPEIEERLRLSFHPSSEIIARGRVSAAVALQRARSLLHNGDAGYCVLAGVDSFLRVSTLATYEKQGRLLTSRQSNGFIPGEAGAALLVRASQPVTDTALDCLAIGLAQEKAVIDSDDPLRGEGLTEALKTALAEAGCALGDIDYRISDANGEQYFFKEASLAMTRVLRTRKEAFALWTPADCLGETGAAAGLCNLAVALDAAQKKYAPGPSAVVHLSNDDGARAAMILRYNEKGAT